MVRHRMFLGDTKQCIGLMGYQTTELMNYG